MSVCPHYQRGNCRYGDRCRMSHGNSHQAPVYHQNNPTFRPHPPRPSIDPQYNYVAPSIANINHHAQNTNQSGKPLRKYEAVYSWAKKNFANENKALDILQQLQKEARDWHKSDHFWRYTSRSLFPGGQPLEGWQDRSFEEDQWMYRSMKQEGRAHVYKKDYSTYFENTARHLFGLLQLRIDILESLKGYINQYVDSNYKPSKTFPSDVEMTDVNGNKTENILSATGSTHYTPDDQLLEDEREAFKSGIFEFGHIPLHPPSKELC